MNTIPYSPEAVHYMQQAFPWAHLRPRHQRHLDRFSRLRFLHGSLGDRPTDRPTHHATWSVVIGAPMATDQWRSQILLLSMATTSIYWSSQLKYTMPAFPS